MTTNLAAADVGGGVSRGPKRSSRRRRVARTVASALALGLLAGACGDDDAAQPATTTTTSTTTASSTTTTAAPAGSSTTTPPSLLPLGAPQTVVSELTVPWALAFVDDRTFLLTERTGAVRVVEDGTLRPEPVLVLDAVDVGEGGVLGLALHPAFPDERVAFVYYTAEDGNRVSRLEVGDDLTMTGERPILEGIPAAPFHDGGRIAFGPDGHLYVTTGDAGDPDRAADLGALAGKILRIDVDGGVPADNPFPGSPVWSYGHRNPQGLAWTSDGTMYATEHGPSGDLGLCCNDEVNRIEPGGFYGWPYRAGNVDAAGGTPPAEPIPPVATSGDDTWAPSGLAAVDGPEGPVLLVAALRGSALLRFDVTGDDVTPRGPVVDDLGRLRIATQGPDGCLYLGTSNTDGRGSPGPDDDRILRACAGD